MERNVYFFCMAQKINWSLRRNPDLRAFRFGGRTLASISVPKRTIREKIPSEAIFPSTHFITLHIIDNLRVFLFSFYGRRFTVQRKSFFHAHHVYISQFIISICSFVRTFCNTKNA